MKFEEFELNEKSINFLKQIESDFNSEIQIEFIDEEEHIHGYASSDTGIPKIQINKFEKFKTEVLIHEAYHLRLHFDGFPIISFEFPNGTMTPQNQEYIKWFTPLFWDKITHRFFYSTILNELEVNPYESCIAEIESIFEEGQIKGLNEITMEKALAGYILQVWIETQNEELLKRFKAFIINKYKSKGIALGSKLIALVKNTNLTSGKKCVHLFKDIFNLIHKKDNTVISAVSYEKEIFETHELQIATLKIN
jgi:hypothetical protein